MLDLFASGRLVDERTHREERSGNPKARTRAHLAALITTATGDQPDQAVLDSHRSHPSMSRKGNCWDNAPARARHAHRLILAPLPAATPSSRPSSHRATPARTYEKRTPKRPRENEGRKGARARLASERRRGRPSARTPWNEQAKCPVDQPARMEGCDCPADLSKHRSRCISLQRSFLQDRR